MSRAPREWAVVTTVLLVLFGLQGGTVAAAGQKHGNEIVYQSPDRTVEVKIYKGVWTVAEIPPLALLSSQKNSGMTYEGVGQRAVNCSDDNVRCIRAGITLAIPRGILRPHQKYEKHGVVFRVDECLRGSSKRCQVALISGVCGNAPSLRDMQCLPTPRRVNHKVVYAYLEYFLYNEDFGVTAFGKTDHEVATEAEKLAVATQMILMSRTGLLRG